MNWFLFVVIIVVAVVIVVFLLMGSEDDYTRRERYIGAHPGLCEITPVIHDQEYLVTIRPDVPSWVASDYRVLLQGLQALTHSQNINYFTKIMTVSDQDNPEKMSIRNGYRVFVSPKRS